MPPWAFIIVWFLNGAGRSPGRYRGVGMRGIWNPANDPLAVDITLEFTRTVHGQMSREYIHVHTSKSSLVAVADSTESKI